MFEIEVKDCPKLLIYLLLNMVKKSMLIRIRYPNTVTVMFFFGSLSVGTIEKMGRRQAGSGTSVISYERALGEKMRGRDLSFFLPDPARLPPAFSIVPTG